MLDQNTDRMWNVIGAVLIGAGIIFGMNTLMPEAFANVGGMFDDLIGIVNYDPDKEEIQDLIAEGYIPVATADELHNVRSATVETYGKGTEWEKEYEGGLDKKYIQVADVDLSEYSEEGWEPIGPSSSSPFTGTYDGGNYVITNLEIQGEDEDNQGLFGYADGATIRNVGLIDNKVTGSGYYLGGLVGTAGSTTIENSYATGSVTGGGYIGGLVGFAQSNSTISNSYAKVTVTGRENVGGLVGFAYSETSIENSYTTGSVTGGGTYTGNVGGLVGWAQSDIKISNSYTRGDVTGSQSNVGGLVGFAYSEITIENSYATGSVESTGKHAGGLVGEAQADTKISNSYATGEVKGREYVGGLVGFLSSSTIRDSYSIGSVTGLVTESSAYSGWNVGGLVGQVVLGTISNSYATGLVTGSENQVGGLVGWELTNNNTTMTSNSYWDKETTGQSTSARGGVGKTTDEMKNQATYEGWDFETIWKIDGNNYPKLR